MFTSNSKFPKKTSLTRYVCILVKAHYGGKSTKTAQQHTLNIDSCNGKSVNEIFDPDTSCDVVFVYITYPNKERVSNDVLFRTIGPNPFKSSFMLMPQLSVFNLVEVLHMRPT